MYGRNRCPNLPLGALTFLQLPITMCAMATDNPQIGTRIRLARERKRWSQQELADATGVDVKTVRNWEKTGRVRNRQGAIESVLGIRFDSDPEPGPGRTAAEDPADELTRLAAEMREAAARLAATRSSKRPNGETNDESRRAV